MPQGSVQNAGFTGASQTFDTASFDSLGASLSSEFTKTTAPVTRTGTDSQTTTSSDTTSSSTSNTANASPAPSTTFATSASTTPGASDPATTSINGYTSGTATNAASNTSGAVTVSEKSACNSMSCSSALQAAVAVPVVVAVIAAIFLFFCCARRRRKRAGAVVSEKRPPKSGKKQKWTRHLRAFSFDAELLMGGRFSSSNSVRSRDPSLRSAATNSRNGAHSVDPSVHSVEEVAPPYRDAISHANPPTSPPRSVPAAAIFPTQRPMSTATAPPPYKSAASPEPRNPFSDSTPVSPVEESPFNDPPEAGGALSRGSSMYRSVTTDDAATPTASEAGSIREAIVGRRVSVRKQGSTSGGSS